MSARLLSQPLDDHRLPDGRRVLDRDLVVDVDGEVITVPAGFDTDYSSVPAVFAWLIDWRRCDVAGVCHDWLFRTQTKTRAHADGVWRVITMSGNPRANAVQGWVCWAGLRLGSWVAWNQRKREKQQRAGGWLQ